jgi:AAA+ ATPase superfamily predicted ATPase
MMMKFIGREKEIAAFRALAGLMKPSLMVIRGRRRIGKSRLAAECAKGRIFIPFSGLAPQKPMSAQDQRDQFAYQLSRYFKLPAMTFHDWSDAFHALENYLTSKPTVILFDEISWMGEDDPTFIGKLKTWWDTVSTQDRPWILILCGSVSTWIEKNIIHNTALFGRISLQIDLHPMYLSECGQFIKEIGFKGSAYETYKLLAVMGGIPWYLQHIHPEQMADENIMQMCFTPGGLLVDEFEKIFHDLFNTRGTLHQKIIRALADGMKTVKEIREKADLSDSGVISTGIQDLIVSGFVTKHTQWSLKSRRQAKQALYRLSDCFLRFYVRYIEPGIKPSEGSYGFQVESLLLQNRALLCKAIGIQKEDIVADNPFLQKETKMRKGCQIDYLIQTVTNNLFVCEFKFHNRELGCEVIDEMEKKIKNFAVPRGYAAVPILFHIGGVSPTLEERRYFYRIIDMRKFLGDPFRENFSGFFPQLSGNQRDFSESI